MKKVAVILSGCGFLDGSEIHESVLTLYAIRKNGLDFECFAPNKNQHHVINHLTQSEAAQTRNVLEEAARIARCKVKPLEELNSDNFSAIILPGGYGAAKNLSNFAFAGSDAEIDNELTRILTEFKAKQKPIGAICIAPAIIAKLFANDDVVLTVGNADNCQNVLAGFGVNYETMDSSEICIDEKNNIVSTPAYMHDEVIENVAAGIEKLVAHIAGKI